MALTLLAGMGAGIASFASAQSTAPSTATVSTVATGAATPTTPVVDPTDSTGTPDVGKAHGHAPMGGDGNITAINGTTISMQEESDEGGATYTIDASNATVTNNGAASSLSNLKAGDKIFVQGQTSGTNVVATSISLGHPGR